MDAVAGKAKVNCIYTVWGAVIGFFPPSFSGVPARAEPVRHCESQAPTEGQALTVQVAQLRLGLFLREGLRAVQPSRFVEASKGDAKGSGCTYCPSQRVRCCVACTATAPATTTATPSWYASATYCSAEAVKLVHATSSSPAVALAQRPSPIMPSTSVGRQHQPAGSGSDSPPATQPR